MDRTEQAVAILKECKLKGLSFYDAKQLLEHNGYSDSEINDATDRFDYQSFTQQQAQPVAANQPITHPEVQIPNNLMPPEQIDDSDDTDTQDFDSWYNSPGAQVIFCAAGLTLTLFIGSYNGHVNSSKSHILFIGSIIITALIILYYGFVAKVIYLGRLGQIAHRGASASLASLVYLAVLAMIAYQNWPKHH